MGGSDHIRGPNPVNRLIGESAALAQDCHEMNDRSAFPKRAI